MTKPLVDFAPAVLVNPIAATRLRSSLLDGRNPSDASLDDIAALLRSVPRPMPMPHLGDLEPAFLGLIPTRGCHLACRYCNFQQADVSALTMPLPMVRHAVTWYLDQVAALGRTTAGIHFFGGEPFYAPEVVDLAVPLARLLADERGIEVAFEVASNGVYSERRAQWIADNIDTIVLSFDGPEEIQNRHRPYVDGRGTFDIVAHTARVLSQGNGDLFLRACVTEDTAGHMADIAAWFCRAFHPKGVCFEPVQPAGEGGAGDLQPPDPWSFARNYVWAAEVLEDHGVQPVYAAADIRARRVSFCPVGSDVAIVSPDGSVDACYLLPQEWQTRGMDLHIGRVLADGMVLLDGDALQATRKENVWNKPACARCLCRWHCAGGCHVHHMPPESPGGYDRLCLQTRILTMRHLLEEIGRRDLVHALLEDEDVLMRAARQPSDLLLDMENACG